MPKFEIKATELVGTRVDMVSLVKRGASRLPFRITKEDTSNMLDLHSLGRKFFQKSEAKPEIVAAIISNPAALEKAASLFKNAGLDPKKFTKSEKDGVITVAVDGYESAENVAVLKVSDEIGLVVTGLQKAFHGYDFESTSFGDVLQTNGFFSSLCTAGDSLRTVISNIMSEADSPADAATSIQKAVDEFKDYAGTLARALPVHAFKMDAAIRKADAPKVEAKEDEKVDLEKAAHGKGAGFEAGKGTGTDDKSTKDDKKNTAVDSTGESTTGKEEKAKNKDKATKGEVPGLPDPKGHESGDDGAFAAAPTDSQKATARATRDDAANSFGNGGVKGSSIPDGDKGLEVRKEEEGADKSEEDKKEAAKKTEDNAILQAISALQKSMEDRISGVAGDVKALNGRVDGLDAQVKKADAALNGIVFNEEGGDAEARSVKKAEGSGAPPLLDTGYTRAA